MSGPEDRVPPEPSIEKIPGQTAEQTAEQAPSTVDGEAGADALQAGGALDTEEAALEPGTPETATPDAQDAPAAVPATAPGAGMPGAGRRAWLWLLIPVIAVASWLAELAIEAAVPPAASWEAAVDVLAEQLQPGDAVWVNPTWAAASWAELERVAMERGLPRGRFVLHSAPLVPSDVARFKRVFIVGRPAADLPPILSEPETLLSAPNLVVQRATVNVTPATDFRAALADAHVERTTPGGPRMTCRWSSDRHTCDGRWWTEVRERMTEVGDTRRSCIWAHAFPDGGVLRIRYPAVTLGTVLSGGVGLTLWTVRQDNGSPVSFRALVDGDVVWEATMPRGDFSWHEMHVDTSPGTADVTFEIRADNTYWRRVCFDAVSW